MLHGYNSWFLYLSETSENSWRYKTLVLRKLYLYQLIVFSDTFMATIKHHHTTLGVRSTRQFMCVTVRLWTSRSRRCSVVLSPSSILFRQQTRMGIDSQDPLPPTGNLNHGQVESYHKMEPKTLGVSSPCVGKNYTSPSRICPAKHKQGRG